MRGDCTRVQIPGEENGWGTSWLLATKVLFVWYFISPDPSAWPMWKKKGGCELLSLYNGENCSSMLYRNGDEACLKGKIISLISLYTFSS